MKTSTNEFANQVISKSPHHHIKISFIITLANLIMITSIIAQSPEKMSYQAVIRNSSNALLTNTQIGMEINILQASPTGTSANARSLLSR